MMARTKTDRSVRARGSEYLECNGIERFVVTCVGRFPKVYRNHRPWDTQELCLQELVDDVNKNACPTTLDEVRSVVEKCVAKEWIEWGHARNGEHILRRTERGRHAYGYGADGNPAYPTPTITDVKAAIRVLLQILYEAKHDAQLRYHGDPRVKDRAVMGSDLYSWVRHRGVSRDAFREAETECLGEGYIVGTPCCGGAWYRITSRGEGFLRGEAKDDPSTEVSIEELLRSAKEEPPRSPPLSPDQSGHEKATEPVRLPDQAEISRAMQAIQEYLAAPKVREKARHSSGWIRGDWIAQQCERHGISAEACSASLSQCVASGIVVQGGPGGLYVDRKGRGRSDWYRATERPSNPTDLMSTPMAVAEYRVSRSTLRRAVKDGRLGDYRPPDSAKNATIMLSRAELDRFWERRELAR